MTSPSEGFARVAEWIALDPDNEPFVFRKFDKLAARNLLYLQAQIISLEKELEEWDKDVVPRSWEQLVEQNKAGKHGRHMSLIVEIRQALKDYHETLLLQSRVSNLPKPSQRVLTAFRHWFNKPFPVLGGQSKNFLEAKDGLVALSPQRDSDPIYSPLGLPCFIQKIPTRDGASYIGHFTEASISIAAKSITILIAANLLVGPIYGLYFAQTPLQRLGLIQLFTTVFALCAGLVTNAKRAELFAMTAA
ncbi:hypothetical protein C8A00DRAFT_47387 [Chaetomidium leptoderma]|uniref:DUF6594 domain-containing protein n=1 Tax=Chaetomidium leptoderma TaxID=669021 RepID=A0AAN6VEX8_9PEZI|nr:hypothetical protein C8A00DRAFT_47387 [Chaetomidium leptoderma]